MRVCAVAVAALVWAVVTAEGQVGAAVMLGRVVDGSGGAVPLAMVTVTDTGTGQTRTTTAADDGLYAVPGLSPGTYRLRVEAAGFQTLVREGVRLAPGETARLDLRLEAGPVTQAVTVTADAPLLRGDAGGLVHAVDNRSVVQLPLNGRNFVALVTLAPGVAMPPAPAALLPRINGGRPRTNEYLFDGISVLQPEPGQVAFFPNVDAIQEFTIESNSPPAEFGRFNGGVVNVVTKSGTNVVHGTGFAFGRHEALNARNYFAASQPVAPHFRRHQFGGVLGGPLRRDRAFFFADYQGQRQGIERPVTSTVPTVLQRQGVFTEAIAGVVPVIYDPVTTVGLSGGGVARTPFPGNAIPADRMDPLARALLARYPLPTSPGTSNNYRRVGRERVDQDQLSGRLDARLSSADAVFGRLTRFRERFVPVAPLPDGSGVASGTPGPQDTTSWSFASRYQRVISPALVNEVRVGDTRRGVTRRAVQLDRSAAQALNLRGLLLSTRFADTLPAFLVAGYQQLGAPPNTDTDFATSVREVADTLTWVKAGHLVKVGADLRWQRLDVWQPASPTGAFTFSSLFTDLPGIPNTGTPLASFLLGQVQQFSIDLQRDEIRNRAHFQEYFAQDDWRVSDRLTVNAGVRYTLNFPSTEETNQSAIFNLSSSRLEYLGRDGLPRSARRLEKGNVGPRIGAVARVGDRTVARAGYGMVWIEQAGITSPFTTPAFPFVQTVTQRTLDNVTPAFVLASGPQVEPLALTPTAGLGQGVFAVDRELGSGYAQQWSASVQRELGSNIAVEVAYTGSRISRVGVPDGNLNQLTVDQLAIGPALLARVPNPYFGTIPRSSSLGDPTISVAQLMKPYPQHTTVSMYRQNIGTTEYHGVYATLQQRLSRGLSYRVSYTRSRLIDDGSAVFDASTPAGAAAPVPVADNFNRRLERDVSNGDIPHVFVASGVWDVPAGRHSGTGALSALRRGWSLSGVFTWQSGTPLAVTQTTNFNAFAGFLTQRPNLVGHPTLPAGERSPARWFNTGAFSPAPAFVLGTSSRNPVRGPGYRNLDVAIVRRVSLAEGRMLEARAEVFNALNTPHFFAPNTVVGSAAFGTITSAGDPRLAQFALKFLF